MPDDWDYPPVGTGAGLQHVILRTAADEPEIITWVLDFEEAAALWRAGQARLRPGGYCVWLNDGDPWRYSGLVNDMPRVWRIRDRALAAGSGEPAAGEEDEPDE